MSQCVLIGATWRCRLYLTQILHTPVSPPHTTSQVWRHKLKTGWIQYHCTRGEQRRAKGWRLTRMNMSDCVTFKLIWIKSHIAHWATTMRQKIVNIYPCFSRTRNCREVRNWTFIISLIQQSVFWTEFRSKGLVDYSSNAKFAPIFGTRETLGLSNLGPTSLLVRTYIDVRVRFLTFSCFEQTL